MKQRLPAIPYLLPIPCSPLSIALLFLIIFPCIIFAQNNAEEEPFTDIPVWRQALGGAVIGHPVAQVESVVVPTDGGNLKSYSLEGRFLWDYFARGRITPHVSRSREGTSYICRTNGILIAVNRSGRELWNMNLGGAIVCPVLIGWDGRLFVFTERKIICMTAAGYTLWSRTLEKKSALTPIRDAAGGVILVQEDGEVLRFDPFGAIVSYTSSTGMVPAAAASIETEGWGHTILLLYEDRHLELVHASMAKGGAGRNEITPVYGESLRGKMDLPSPPLAAVGINAVGINAVGTNAAGITTVGKKDEAAVLLRDGQIALLSVENRKILWTARGHIRAEDIPGIFGSEKPGPGSLDFFYDERGVYVVTKTGATGFTPDGRRLWYMRLRGAAAIPSFGDDGILYSGGIDWILYAYRLENQVRAKQRLLYGEAPEGSYGTGNPGTSSWADYYFRFSETELETRLGEIRQAIKEGAVGENEKEYSAWLMETAGSLMDNPRTGNHPPVHTKYRMEAARLLAFIGSRETIPFLADLFSKDTEVLVKAAAAEAIGKIGVDPEGLAMRAFERAVYPPFPLLTDEAALTAVAAATGALSRFSGPPLSEAGVRLLTLLSSADRPPSARRQAQRELISLGR